MAGRAGIVKTCAKTEPAWHEALLALSPHNREILQAQCRNLHLGIECDEMAGSRDRAAIMKAIQRRLLEEPVGFAGPVEFRKDVQPRGLIKATAYRTAGATEARCFTHSSGSWQEPDIKKSCEKLTKKRYQTDHPLDLFAYSLHDEVYGAIGVAEVIDACVDAHRAAFLFSACPCFRAGFPNVFENVSWKCFINVNVFTRHCVIRTL